VDLWSAPSALGDGEVPASTRLPTALPGACSVAPSAKPRLGALLSSDDYGSRVGLAGAGQVLWRLKAERRLRGAEWCGRVVDLGVRRHGWR
jgi:hypothetical protein